MSEVLKNYGEGEEEFDEDGEIVKPEFSDLEEWEEEIRAEKTSNCNHMDEIVFNLQNKS